MNANQRQEIEIPSRCVGCAAFGKVLIVRETSAANTDAEENLRTAGFAVRVCHDWKQACGEVGEFDCELLIWDAQKPVGEEIAGVRQLRQRCPRLPILVLMETVEAETAISLAKVGVHDVLAKPVPGSSLREVVNRVVLCRQRLCAAVLVPRATEARAWSGHFVGRSPAMQDVYRRIGLVAERNEPVLIHGETGSGKELVARAIHQHSRRRDQVFLAINCAALSESLLESELFGHEKGAFTGAAQRRLGAFEIASDGTLFLDEIGDMSLMLQGKILRALQQGEIHRLGGHETIPVDVRVLAATNKSLEQAIQQGKFREDLYYRLNVVSIRVPPLREHMEDLLPLVEHFIDQYTPPGEPRPGLDRRAVEKLQTRLWPGNIRELENTVRRALMLAAGQTVLLEKDIVLANAGEMAPCCRDKPPRSSPAVLQEAPADIQLDLALENWLAAEVRNGDGSPEPSLPVRMEMKLLVAALNCTQGNQVHAARLLGISRSTLREWLKKIAGRRVGDGA